MGSTAGPELAGGGTGVGRGGPVTVVVVVVMTGVGGTPLVLSWLLKAECRAQPAAAPAATRAMVCFGMVGMCGERSTMLAHEV